MLRTFTIQNTLGLHARAAASFVKVSNRFQCEIMVRKDSTEVNGKSIMGVMMLAAAKGVVIDVCVDGADADEALTEITQLVQNRFGESE